MVEEEFDGLLHEHSRLLVVVLNPKCLEPEMFVLLDGLNTEQNWLTDCLRSLKTPFLAVHLHFCQFTVLNPVIYRQVDILFLQCHMRHIFSPHV